jgi:hypothetical protein
MRYSAAERALHTHDAITSRLGGLESAVSMRAWAIALARAYGIGFDAARAEAFSFSQS